MRSLRIAIGIPLVAPGFLMVPSYVSRLYMSWGGTQGSVVHYTLVLSALIGAIWLGMWILNGGPTTAASVPVGTKRSLKERMFERTLKLLDIPIVSATLGVSAIVLIVAILAAAIGKGPIYDLFTKS